MSGYRCLFPLAVLLLAGLTPAAGSAQTPGYGTDSYGYPVEDGISATVVGTPAHLQFPLEKGRPRFRLMKLQTRPRSEVPEYFWYHRNFKYLLFQQRGPAPLVFLLAGTGGTYTSGMMLFAMRAFYDAGFHVVGLPNPTHMNFIINASRSGVPGLPAVDAADLYAVLKKAWSEQLSERIEVTDFHFTGYSLGGTLSGWMAKIDAEEQFFNFKKVLLVNPSVNLYNSVSILDGYLDANLEGPDQQGFREFWEDMMEALAGTVLNEGLTLDEDFLYDAYLTLNPDEISLELLIGTAFRISAQSIMVTADVMSGSSFIVPATTRAGIHYNVDDFFIVSARTSFVDYFDGLLLPHYQARDPSLTREEAVAQAGLGPIEDFLRQASHVGVVHNADDIILADGEIAWLKDVFGERAKIWPRGGHLGNFEYRDNVQWMLDFFDQ